MCSKQFFISRINLQTFIMNTGQSIMAVSYLKKPVMEGYYIIPPISTMIALSADPLGFIPLHV